MLICIILALVMIFIFVTFPVNILYLMKGFLFVYSFHEIQIFDYCRQCEAAHVIEVISYTEEVLDTCVIPCAQFERFWCWSVIQAAIQPQQRSCHKNITLSNSINKITCRNLYPKPTTINILLPNKNLLNQYKITTFIKVLSNREIR